MKPIGGYFELELQKGNESFHAASAFKSGRSALHYILSLVKPHKVYIPFYTCDALLEPFELENILYEFYALDSNLDPASLPELGEGEFFLYINYFDLKRRTVKQLSEKYKEQLIIDCSQAFFYKEATQSWCFNSCRKFFGVPDGGYLYAPKTLNTNNLEKNKEYLVNHLLHRLNGETTEGYPFFLQNERLCNADIKAMSILSEHLLSNINFEEVSQKRRENFAVLHQIFGKDNLLILQASNKAVPMAYPLLVEKKINHSILWESQVFIPVLWKDVLYRKSEAYSFEKELSNNLLPLPVDHRYTVDDMHYIADIIKSI